MPGTSVWAVLGACALQTAALRFAPVHACRRCADVSLALRPASRSERQGGGMLGRKGLVMPSGRFRKPLQQQQAGVSLLTRRTAQPQQQQRWWQQQQGPPEDDGDDGPVDQILRAAQNVPNVAVNEALLIVVIALTTFAVLTVDSDAWRGWYPQEVLFRVPLDNWSAYEAAVSVDPVPIKSIITGITYLIGDGLAQANALRKQGRPTLDLDRPRLLRSTIVGTVLLGPLAHFYYEWVAYSLDAWSVPSKILLDQTAYLAFYNTVYFLSLTVLGGRSFGDACDDYARCFWKLLTSGWKLWPLVGIVTYTLIPQQNRVLWIDGIEIIYSALLSSLTNEDGGGE